MTPLRTERGVRTADCSALPTDRNGSRPGAERSMQERGKHALPRMDAARCGHPDSPFLAATQSRRTGTRSHIRLNSQGVHTCIRNAPAVLLHPLRTCLVPLLLALTLGVGAAGSPADEPSSTLSCYPNKIPAMTTPEIIEWSPEEGKYLFPICQFGRLSNQMNCVLKYCWFAAALNRTVLLPRYGAHGGVEKGGYRWRWDVVLDLVNMRRCLEASGTSKAPRIMTVDELLNTPYNETHTVQGVPCQDNDKLKDTVNCSAPWPHRRCVYLEKVFSPSKNSIAYLDQGRYALSALCPFNGTQVVLGATPKLTWDLLREIRTMAANMSVISLGSIFYEEVLGTPGKGFFRGKGHNLGPFKLSKDCPYLWPPAPAVVGLAQKAIQYCTKGQPYASAHLRRGDFRISHKQSDQAWADYFVRWLSGKNLTTVFISTDADNATLSKIKGLVAEQWKGPPLKYCQLHDVLLDPSWRLSVEELETGDAGLVLAVIDKQVCSRSKAFFGNRFSSFSEHIFHMREANGLRSEDDANCG